MNYFAVLIPLLLIVSFGEASSKTFNVISDSDLDNLLKLAKQNKNQAENEFKQKYSNLEYHGGGEVSPFSNALELFGHLIVNLRIEFNSNQYGWYKKVWAIRDAINAYTAATLKDFELNASVTENFFNNVQKPFVRLEDISLNAPSTKLDGGDKLFPALNDLEILIFPTNLANVKLSHLNRLLIQFPDGESNVERENAAKSFLTNNRNIKALKVIHGSQQLVKFIKDNLRNITNLEIVD